MSKRDLIFHNQTWEVKRASTINAAADRTRNGLTQIKQTGGNLIIDLWDDDFESAFDSMLSSMKRYAPNYSVDVIVMRKGKFNRVIRYTKTK